MVDMGFYEMFSDPHCRYLELEVDLVLIRLVDMSFNRVFTDPHCRYLGPTGESAFNQIGGHGF